MILVFLAATSAFAGSLTLGPGTTVVVTDVAGNDPNAMERGAMLGEVCAVGKAPLVSSGDGWWRGQLVCANGVTYNTTGVSVTVPGTQPQPRSVSASSIAAGLGSSIKLDAAALPAATVPPPVVTGSPNVAPSESLRRDVRAGEAVRIVALSPEDAYFSDRAEIVGVTCYPTDDMSYNEDGWHGGPMTCWDGRTFYFYKVGLATDPTHGNMDIQPQVETGGGLGALLGGGDDRTSDPGVLDEGTKVVIKDVSPDDAFFSDRMSLIGKSCKVTGDLHPQNDADWYGGGLTCKKNYYYFYKVRVDVK